MRPTFCCGNAIDPRALLERARCGVSHYDIKVLGMHLGEWSSTYVHPGVLLQARDLEQFLVQIYLAL